MKRLLLACAMLLGPVLPVLAVEVSWVGTWKLDPAKSHFTGETFTYSKGSGAMIRYSDGSTTTYDFAIDGKPYKSYADRTTTWTQAGERSWDSVTKQSDTVLFTFHRELSADGKALTVTSTGKRPDGSPMNDAAVYERVGKGTGLIGKWRSTKVDVPSPGSAVIATPAPGAMKIEYPEWKATLDGRLDGKEFKPTGPTIPPGTTVSMRAVSPTKISYVWRLNGKPDSYGVQTLAANGKSFTDVSWSPGKQAEKSTAYFVRQ